MSYFNKKIPDFLNSEKFTKIFELFLPKCQNLYFLYTAEDLENIKKLDQNITTIEDISKLDENNLVFY
jgi:hypothetical protein